MRAPEHRLRWASAVLPVIVVVLTGCGGSARTGDRQAEVAERGAEVMPFDLDATTHTFTTTPDGGIQSVTADDPGDDEQVRLIREHLRVERDNFARGDFDDPAAIHGHDMDGVAELRAGYRAITVEYADLPDGAQLTYTASTSELAGAIHAWFDRQVADHGDHARSGEPADP